MGIVERREFMKGVAVMIGAGATAAAWPVEAQAALYGNAIGGADAAVIARAAAQQVYMNLSSAQDAMMWSETMREVLTQITVANATGHDVTLVNVLNLSGADWFPRGTPPTIGPGQIGLFICAAKTIPRPPLAEALLVCRGTSAAGTQVEILLGTSVQWGGYQPVSRSLVAVRVSGQLGDPMGYLSTLRESGPSSSSSTSDVKARADAGPGMPAAGEAYLFPTCAFTVAY